MKLRGYFFPTPWLDKEDFQDRVQGAKAVLCTLATLSSPALEKNSIFLKRPLRRLVIDEASQIDMTSEFMVRFFDCWSMPVTTDVA